MDDPPPPPHAAPTTPAPPPVEEDDGPSDLEVWLSANAGKTVTAADVLDQARIEAGLDPEDLDRILLLDRWDACNGMRWQVGQAPPSPVPGQMNDYVVLAILVGDQADKIGDVVAGEGRIYVLPKTAGAPCYRYTLSRVPGSGGHRAPMKMQMFIEELAHEVNRLAVIFEVIDDDEDDEDEEDEPGPN
jgi:hypothetical protein